MQLSNEVVVVFSIVIVIVYCYVKSTESKYLGKDWGKRFLHDNQTVFNCECRKNSSCRIVTYQSQSGWESDTFFIRMKEFVPIFWDPNNLGDTFIKIKETTNIRSAKLALPFNITNEVEELIVETEDDLSPLKEPIPHSASTPYYGTFSKPRYTGTSEDVIIYPKHTQRLRNFTHLSGTELLGLFDGNETAMANKHQYLMQYRQHTLSEKWQNASSYHSNTMLIIINCFYFYPNTIQFLKERFFSLFAGIFPRDFDLLFFSRYFDSTQRILKNRFLSPGFYAYRSLRVAYSLFPPSEGFHYSGYLMMSDDSYVDPQYLATYDMNLSWGEYRKPYGKNDIDRWNSYHNAFNVSFSRAFFEAVDELAGMSKVNERCSFSSGKVLMRGLSDFVYITKMDMELMLMIDEVMFQHRVFLQFAVPTILHCLNKKSVVNCNYGLMEENTKCVHINPVNMSSVMNQQFVIRRIRHENIL